MAHGPSVPEARHLRTLFSVGAAGVLTDGQLLERFSARDGDRAELAFAALVERHGSMVLRVARAVLGDEHSAHDTFQATFLILARKAQSLWVRDSLGPWLHAVAFRVASGLRAFEGRHRRLERGASKPEAFEPVDRDRLELARAIHEEIGRLPEPYRAAVVACLLEGSTQVEAAVRLGWSVGTLQSRLARGRRRLRDRLQRRGIAPSLAPIAGPTVAVPSALMASTARAAAALQSGGSVAGLVAPAALALIETTTKGMLMSKLKLAALALVTACTLAASGMGLGLGNPAKATDGPAPAIVTSRPDEPIPPPSDGPGFPFLLEFYEGQSVAGREAHKKVSSLAGHGYPIKSYDCSTIGPDGRSPGRAEADRHFVHDYPTILLVDGSGAEMARMGAFERPSQVAAFFNENRSKPAGQPKPAGNTRPARRTLETVVRVWVEVDGKESVRQLGTIVSSSPGESIILTTSRGFDADRVIRGKAQPRVRVDLFDGEPSHSQPTTVRSATLGLAAEILAIQTKSGLALLRLQHDKGTLPSSTIVEESWSPASGLKLATVRNPKDYDFASLGETVLKEPKVTPWSTVGETKGVGTREVMACSNWPTPGSWGGGLFTDDGALCGVYLGGGPGLLGYYARPEAIREFLGRHAPTPTARPLAANPDPAPPRPWETVVRVRVVTKDRMTEQSGTIIASSKEESIVLTTARGFTGIPIENGVVRATIQVDLFDGQGASKMPASLGTAERNLAAEFVACEAEPDLALLRIRPGRILPASPVADESWNPIRGLWLIAAGASMGRANATTWETVIQDPSSTRPRDGGTIRNLLQCAIPTGPGAIGGGLFTDDGRLGGVCVGIGPEGLYLRPEVVREFLDRHNLVSTHQKTRPEPPASPSLTLPPGMRLDEPPLPREWKPAKGPTAPRTPLARVRLVAPGKPEVRQPGAIVFSSGEESILLTNARGLDSFEVVDGERRVTIRVDLFDGAPDSKDLKGELRASDRTHDLAILRIKPGRTLPASRVVPEGWEPSRGMPLFAACLVSGDLFATWPAEVVEPDLTIVETPHPSKDSPRRHAIRCSFGGSSAGGLYTPDGLLAGFGLGEPGRSDLFTRPDTIRALLRSFERSKTSNHLLVPADEPSAFSKYYDPKPSRPKVVFEEADPGVPRPWETAVRVKVHHSDTEWGFASGTVIRSTDREALVLTSAHTFRVKGEKQPLPKDYRVPITVDLFDGQIDGQRQNMLGVAVMDLTAEVVDYDFNSDLALLRVRTDRRVPASTVVPPQWKFARLMPMIALGCSHGANATVMDTSIVDLWVPLNKPGPDGTSESAFKCQGKPAEGRAGGGLFTSEGYLAGVCAFGDPDQDAGLYVCPGAIHRLLDRNHLTSLYLQEEPPAAPPSIASAPPSPLVDDGRPIRAPSRIVEPVLLHFYSSTSEASRLMKPEVDKLVRAGYSVRSIDVDASPELAEQYKVKEVPTFVVKTSWGNESGRASGVVPAWRLAAIYNNEREDPADISEEPGLASMPLPKPWETVVRVRVSHDGKAPSVGSGTIVESSRSHALILTSAQLFRASAEQKAINPKTFGAPIRVDLFDGQLTGRRPAKVTGTERDVVARLVDCDFESDLALIRIDRNAKLPASKVVPPSWSPKVGMNVVSVGCSHGNDATAWDSKILDPRVPVRNPSAGLSLEAIKCSQEPREGRSGGGLFTLDGHLAGVCAFADPQDHSGLYVDPATIYRFLSRNSLGKLYADESTARTAPKPEGPVTLEPVPPPTVSDQGRRLDDLERKLDRVLKALDDLKGGGPSEGDNPIPKR